MKNLYDIHEAEKLHSDLDLRVYTSNLLGQSDELVLHGGGNTSVKTMIEDEEVLLVKGSGWDLVSIKAEGFAPVKLQTLLEMAQRESLSDSAMVSEQKAAMLDKNAPNPSVEAILHALIPFKFVDHTHADAVVTISNSKNGIDTIKQIFPNFLIVPYVMPGFILAQRIYEMSKNSDWSSIEGIILHNHGIFTFDDDAKASYDKMIAAVTLAEAFLEKEASVDFESMFEKSDYDVSVLQELIAAEKGHEVFMYHNEMPLAHFYASQETLESFATRGVLTPEHIIRTKRIPLILEGNESKEALQTALKNYQHSYKTYFETFSRDEIMLNATPNYVVIKNHGVITFGKTQKEANIINDIIEHTMLAVLRADKLGGYESISLSDSFDMEYWELEQAKLKK